MKAKKNSYLGKEMNIARSFIKFSRKPEPTDSGTGSRSSRNFPFAYIMLFPEITKC